jgi:vancomycin resistance protein YoaR
MNTGAEINLIVREAKPTLKDSEEVAQKVRAALGSPIQIYINPGEAKDAKDPGPWQVSPDFIAGMISIKRADDADGTAHYDLSANVEPLKNFLNQLAPQLSVTPVNARFLFDDNTGQLQVITDSVDGRSLDVDATMKQVQDTIFKKDDRRVALVFHKDIPKVSSQASAEQLGIKEQIVSATTFFYGSTAERRTNIQVAASRFQGLVIAPGEEFSFNKYLGDVTPETGFQTGLVIYGNQTIAGVGGGVCQVSTTVFQAAFFSGLPIRERYAHGYRVGYYESGTVFANGQKYNSGVGLDATVYSPIIDLKFVNDTPYYLLMESVYRANEQSLTFKFYSTSTGRVVSKDGPTLGRPVPHGPNRYQETAGLRPGEQRQVDFAVDGVDAHVYRTITQNGQVVVNHEDFYSHYLPWSAIFQVAPGYAPKSASGG